MQERPDLYADNGHFTDKNVTFANFAGQFAFVLWQLGHPDFELKTEIHSGK